MSRDPHKLKVFLLADELVVDIYREAKGFPGEERYGLTSQIRRAAVSVSPNIVEGCARRTSRDYLKFLDIALASASETRYLISLAARLELIASVQGQALISRYNSLLRGLQALITALQPAPR